MAGRLSFGFNPPDGVDTAWGARWIIDPNGTVDQVWDRTDAIGPDDHRRSLLNYLDNQVGDAPHKTAQRLLREAQLSWSGDTTVTLYDDDVVTVVGNPRRSFGPVRRRLVQGRPSHRAAPTGVKPIDGSGRYQAAVPHHDGSDRAGGRLTSRLRSRAATFIRTARRPTQSSATRTAPT
jgi:hypothetical protein